VVLVGRRGRCVRDRDGVTDPDADPHARATQIIVPADTPGVDVVRPVPVLGHAGRGWTTHCEVRYTNVRVPVTNTLGAEGAGFLIAQKRLGPGASTM
jgi:Acyl-CoA dehydrogenases